MSKITDLKPKTERELNELEMYKLENMKLRRAIIEFKKSQMKISILYSQEKKQSAQMLETLVELLEQEARQTEKKLQEDYTKLLASSGIDDAIVDKKGDKIIFREMTAEEKKDRDLKTLSGN
jgi:hypothetical protein